MTTNGVPTAWIENGNPYGISATNGSFFLDLTGYTNSGTYGGVTQSVTGLTVGTNYALTFDLGYGGNSTAFGGPVTVRVDAGSSSATFTSGSGTPKNPAVWDGENFDFTASSATEAVTILGLSTAGGEYIGIDNADLELATVAPVPEPSTIAMFGTSLLGLGWLARRRT
ncbi:MAG: PEP-CTERM sorting domain-containing protein [Stellaceae bacterium]